MKKAKMICSAILAAAAVLSMAGCDSDTELKSGDKDALQQSTSASTTTNTLDDDVNNPVDITDFVEEATLENPNITYFGYYDMRVAGDIKPGVKLFEETYGGKIDYVSCTWDERIDKLQMMIAADNSPDLVDREEVSFPYMITMNVYEDLTDYIDLTQPHWQDYAPLVESYEWEGGHYYYPFTATALPDCLIYNKDVFENLGINDPKELYDKGEWTWDTFKQSMIQFMERQDGAIGGVYGLLGNDIMLTTGVPLVGYEGGVITNNMETAALDRAASFLMELRREGLAVRGDGMWSNEPAPLAKHKVAFLGVGTWKITDFCKDYPDETYGFVPYPRDPAADKYYYNCSAQGYFVPKGASNIEGAAAFIDIMRKCNEDPELKAVVKESIMNDKKYSEEQYEFLTSFEDIGRFDYVINFSNGFNSDLSKVIDGMLTNLAFEQGEDQKTWTQFKGEYKGVIDAVLDDYT